MKLGSPTEAHRFELGQFTPTVTVSDGEPGGDLVVSFREITVLATGNCIDDGSNNNERARRLTAWWGIHTEVTATRNTALVIERQRSRFTFRRGDLATTREATRLPGAIESGCVTLGVPIPTNLPVKRYLFVHLSSPHGRIEFAFVREDRLIRPVN